jgi:prepilin-type N-terminal cleavage/methylation domain-containing protein/prepilin-type processing-associated H-X9-DG protein
MNVAVLPFRRSGFTVIELLISIAVISALLALLFPAIMSARASAHAAKCKNNLRQLGVAFNKPEHAGSTRRDNIVEAFDLKNPVETTIIRTFRCPVDNGSAIVHQQTEHRQGVRAYARSNYNGCAGDGESRGFYYIHDDNFYPATHEMIADETSMTFALGEQDSEDDDPMAPWWHCQVVGNCEKAINSRNDDGTKSKTCFRSRHSERGAHFLMVDGSVKFIREGIDMPTYRALSTIDGGDVVGEF